MKADLCHYWLIVHRDCLIEVVVEGVQPNNKAVGKQVESYLFCMGQKMGFFIRKLAEC